MSDNKDNDKLMFSMQKDTAEIAQLLARGKSPRLERIQESLAEDAFTAPMEIIEEELREAGIDPEQVARESNLLVKTLMERNRFREALLEATYLLGRVLDAFRDDMSNSLADDLDIWLDNVAALRNKIKS